MTTQSHTHLFICLFACLLHEFIKFVVGIHNFSFSALLECLPEAVMLQLMTLIDLQHGLAYWATFAISKVFTS